MKFEGKGGLTPDGYDIRRGQDLSGHAEVSTTQIYTNVLNRGGRGMVSPQDRGGAAARAGGERASIR